MRMFIEAINIAMRSLLIFKFPKNKVQANKLLGEENKYSVKKES